MSDLISRCELFNRLARIPITDGVAEYGAQIYATIQTMDAVEMKRGHWEYVYDEKEVPFCRNRWYCSWCGDWQGYGEPKYCPNCGARMIRGEDNEQVD